MLSKNEVWSLIGKMESEFIERTISTTNTDKFGEAICAFSNDLSNRKEVGYLFLGVSDNQGELSGLKVTDETSHAQFSHTRGCLLASSM